MDINPAALRVIRERSGLTQSDLSRLAGISQGYISELEKDGRKRPTPAMVLKLADALGVPVASLVSRLPVEPAPDVDGTAA